MVITGKRLQDLAQQIITQHEPHIGPASIDVHLGPEFQIADGKSKIFINKEGETIYQGFKKQVVPIGETIRFRRNHFYIAHSLEYLTIPSNVVGLLFLRSTSGRRGLDHLHAGYLEPGWHGQITFELQPAVTTEFVVGSRIAQVVFIEASEHAEYTGTYNGQTGATVAPSSKK